MNSAFIVTWPYKRDGVFFFYQKCISYWIENIHNSFCEQAGNHDRFLNTVHVFPSGCDHNSSTAKMQKNEIEQENELQLF